MKIILTLLCLILFYSSINGQSNIIPIVEMKIGGLIGGVENGKWIPVSRVGKTIKRESEFVLVGWKGVEEGGVSFGTKSEPDVPCMEFYPVEMELEMDSGVAIGSGAKWNPMPRKLSPIDLNNAAYKKEIAAVLKSRGIAKTTVKITRAFRVDLEGDGTDEVILAATYYRNGLSSSAKVGDYSVVLLRKIISGKVQNIVLSGEFVTKNIAFGAPAQYELSSIADLNGDGKMEIVIYGKYYEGHWVEVHELIGNKPIKVKTLTAGCGV
jgi:hypothetical protein